MRIVLLGPPGVGQSAQGERIAEQLRIPRIALGEVPLHDVSHIVRREVESHTAGFVLDGFPGSVAHARTLDAFLRTRAAELDVALRFVVPDAAFAEPSALRAEELLLEYYRGRVVEVDAVGTEDDVFERVLWGLRESLLVA